MLSSDFYGVYGFGFVWIIQFELVLVGIWDLGYISIWGYLDCYFEMSDGLYLNI